MAKQTVNIGTTANDGTGDPLRTAFTKLNQNFDEVYGNNFVTTNLIANDAVTADKIALFDDALAATNTHVLVADGTDFNNVALSGDATISNTGVLTIANDAVTADKLADSINSEIAANTAKVTNATHTGDVTGSTALTIANDVVDYDKLAGEFTTASALTAATDLDVNFSTAAVFTTTSSIAMDLNFTNAEIGQVKTIVVTDSGGTSSLTFDTATNTVVNLNGTYSATAGAVNYIQAQCIAANSFILTISQAAA